MRLNRYLFILRDRILDSNGMNPSEEQIQRRLDGALVFKNLMSLIGPIQVCRNVPTEAPGITECLCLRTVGFPPSQLLSHLFLLGDIHGTSKDKSLISELYLPAGNLSSSSSEPSTAASAVTRVHQRQIVTTPSPIQSSSTRTSSRTIFRESAYGNRACSFERCSTAYNSTRWFGEIVSNR